MNKRLVFGVMGAALGLAGAASAAERTFITIGTGGLTGVYYPAGGAICRMVNKGVEAHGIRCSVESTSGSPYNVNTIRAGEFEFGVVQSDVHFNAFNGLAPFAELGPFDDMRSVFSLHPEPFTVVARADAGIANFADLKGKRVNIGDLGSGQRATMDVVMAAFGWTNADFSLAAELKPGNQSQALCDGKVDAIIYTVGHPNGSIQDATTACDSTLVQVNGPLIDDLIQDKSYYRAISIPGGMYNGNPDDIETFGISATFVTSRSVPDAVVYELVKAVMTNFEDYKKLHPVFQALTKDGLSQGELTAPLHPGAERYFRESGIL